jgi:hypothetical protein
MSNSSISDSRLRANRQNAQLSTGPVTEVGKAASARNNVRHGLAGAFSVLPGESLEEFEQLRADFEEEHKPATTTESLLVTDMARHYWLYQRALRLQEECFASDLGSGDTQNRLNLLLRYGTTHERAFRRCLADLLKLRKQRLQLERGFESQKHARAAERRREVAAQCRWMAGKKMPGGSVPLGSDEINDILEGFEALDDYFRTPAYNAPSIQTKEGGQKAA